MRELPLTKKQIEICDFVFKKINQHYVYDELQDMKHEPVDINVSSKYMLDNGLISCFNPVIITDLGTKYIDKGIVNFIKHKRRDDFLNSTIIKTVAVWIAIIISLAFGIVNYCHNQKNERNKNEYIKYSEIDSILNKKGFKNHNNKPIFNNKIDSIDNMSNHIDKIKNVKTE